MRCTLLVMWRLAVLLIAACGRVGFDAFDVACPPAYIEVAEGCYRFELDDPDELEWLDAEAACEADGAHLAVVDGAAELALFTAMLGTVEDAWVGASDRITPDVFITVTRAPFFVQWGDTEPNGTGDCVEVERGEMGDSDCAVRNDYICELDGRSADPTTY